MMDTPPPPPDREASPDWLRSFQTPSKGFGTLSSSSLSSSSDDTKLKQTLKVGKTESSFYNDTKEEVDSAQLFDAKPRVQDENLINLDSDPEETGEDKKIISTRTKLDKVSEVKVKESKKKVKDKTNLLDQEDQIDLISPLRGSVKDEEGAHEEDATEGQERRAKRVLSTLPLVFGDKVHRSKVLLECEGDALDVSGDVGAVGRLSVLGNSNDDFLLDLKGVIYKATIVPSNTFFVVNIGQSEAKVEALMNDFVQLQPSTNIFEAETMVEGTLEGFGFDSDQDGDYVPAATEMINNESKDKKALLNQKMKSDKPLKPAKVTVRKSGKGGTSKSIGKSGGARKLNAAGKGIKKKSQKRGK